MSGVLDTSHLDQSINTSFSDNVAAADPKFVKYPAGQWSVSNPHPGYGIDPNILNEFGHTKYPMWVGQTIVNNAKEEAEALGKSSVSWNDEKPALREDGPTIKEYVEAGYKADTYPPKGFASKSSNEEIKEFVDKETKVGW